MYTCYAYIWRQCKTLDSRVTMATVASFSESKCPRVTAALKRLLECCTFVTSVNWHVYRCIFFMLMYNVKFFIVEIHLFISLFMLNLRRRKSTH